jgi:hypothetical protein
LSLKSVFDSLEKDKVALLDAFEQLFFLSKRQREIVMRDAAKDINDLVKDKTNSIDIINKIKVDIQKKIAQIKAKGTISDKEGGEKFILELEKKCKNIITKIMELEAEDKDFISKTRDSLLKEIKDVDLTRGKLKDIKGAYSSRGGSFFDKEG